MIITKHVIITGSSSGIGRAVALDLAREGHRLFLTGRNSKKLETVKNEVESLGGDAAIAVGDVGSERDVATHFKVAMDFFNGRIDVLFANAGIGYFGYLEEMSIQQFDEQFNTNVRGVFLWLKHVLPVMKQQGHGQVIVTSSQLGLRTSPRASIYCATKHAIQGLIGALRQELVGTGVKAATINPGAVDTPWFDGKTVDRKKMLSVEDVVRAVRLIIDQGPTSDIDHVLLVPARRNR